jgi:hypothetical protein
MDSLAYLILRMRSRLRSGLGLAGPITCVWGRAGGSPARPGRHNDILLANSPNPFWVVYWIVPVVAERPEQAGGDHDDQRSGTMEIKRVGS